MRLIPTMTVVMPADGFETEQAVRAAAATEGPFDISLAGGELPLGVQKVERTFSWASATAARRRRRDDPRDRPGRAGLRAGELLAEQGVSARVLSMHTVKPLDREAVLEAAKTPLIVTIEEHTVIGGLGGAVAEVSPRRRGRG